MDYPAKSMSRSELRAWLLDLTAEQSFVYDMAPMTVAPSKNVVGHVQIYKATPYQAEQIGKPDSELLVISRIFVKRNTFEFGITRFLLKESIRFSLGQGKTPILDLASDRFLSKKLCTKVGFVEVGSPGSASALMRYTG